MFENIRPMIYYSLYIGNTPNMGRGVYTREAIAANTIIEVSPVIVMSREERKLLDQTTLHDYIHEWGYQLDQCCLALGYCAVYNHSYHSNCEYEMDFEASTMTIKTVRAIEEGEQLYVNYNGNWNDTTPLWFPAQ